LLTELTMKYLAGVSSMKIEADLCNGCGICLQVCPHQALALEDNRACVRDLDLCMECGACSRNCSQRAIFVHPGVGCANAILRGMIHGTAPDCGCSHSKESCC
jgi:NAD-dependent dihydropyrimidine dehydrogenase PreA subunit